MISIAEKKEKYFLLFFGILLIFAREVKLLTEPRFWAEEGSVFFAFAYKYSFLENIATIHVGYYTLLNVLVSSFSVLLPIEFAPAFTSAIGFFIQVIPFSIVVFSKSMWWNTGWKKIIIGILIIVASPPELWINTTNSHFYLGLITVLILLTDSQVLSGFEKWFYRMMLLLGGLTGPASMLVVPGYLLKSYRERNKEVYIQTAIIVLCALVQSIIIIYAALYNNKYHRFSQFDFIGFIISFCRDGFALLLPFAINERSVIGLLLAPVILWIFFKKIKDVQWQYVLLSFFSVSLFSLFGSLKMQGGLRYSYIPTIIIFILLISEVPKDFKNIYGRPLKFLIGLLIVCVSLHVIFYQKKLETAYSSEYPKWKNEVKMWRENDENYLIKIHPYSEAEPWNIDLRK